MRDQLNLAHPTSPWARRTALAPGSTAVVTERPVRSPIAVIVSRFPLITETFILREITELERQGQPVVLVPLIRESPRVVHPEAVPWLERALYSPFISPAVALANLRLFRRAPGCYLAVMGRALLGAARSPSVLLRTAVLLPKAALLAEQLRAAGVQHLHAHFATHPSTVALVAAELSGFDFSITAHAHDIFVNRALLASKLRRARFVRLISDFNQAFLDRLYPDLLGERGRVIHVGVEVDRYAVSARRRLQQPPTSVKGLLCIAALKPYKGIPVLLDALQWLAGEGIHVPCEIVGDGPQRRVLERRIRKAGLADHVRLHGALPQAEVTALLARADALVLPSIVAPDGQMEGIPVALMEAMAAGLPVIASAISGIPELVRGGVSGLLVPPGDAASLARAIRRLIEDPELGWRLGANGREMVEREFSLDDCAAQLLSEFDRVNAPVAARLADRVRAAADAAGQGGAIGIRRVHEGPDSCVVEFCAAGSPAPRELALKVHRTRAGESAPATARARRECELLRRLQGDGVPRALALDEPNASILMERCRGVSLVTLVRSLRRGHRPADLDRLSAAMGATGAWIREFQERTTEAGRADVLLEQQLERALRDLAAVTVNSRAQRAHLAERLRSLRTMVATGGQRVVVCHGDFWPGNVFIAGDAVSVIDFEGLRPGLAYQDVAYFLVHLHPYLGFPVVSRRRTALTQAFLDGYLAGRRVDAAALAFCGLAATLSDLAVHRPEPREPRTALWSLQHRRRQRALRALLMSWS